MLKLNRLYVVAVLLSVLCGGQAAASGLAARAQEHVEIAVEDGLEPADFHHLVLALRWRTALPDWSLVDRLVDRLAAAGGDPLMADEVRRYRALVAEEEGRSPAARELFRAMGGLERWWVHGPLGLDELADFDDAAAPVGEDVSWRRASGTNPMGWVRLSGVAWPAQRQLVYLGTVVESDRQQAVALRVGVAQAGRVWLNGVEVLTSPRPLAHAPDQIAGGGWLRAGTNLVVAAVASESEDWWLRVRLTTPDGSPLTGVREVDADPSVALSDSGLVAQPPSEMPAVRTLESEIRAAVEHRQQGAQMALAAYLATRRPQPVGAGAALAACRAARAEAPAAARYLEWFVGTDPATVQEVLEEAVEADPGFLLARVALAAWYHRRGLFERAAEAFGGVANEPAMLAASLDLDSILWGPVMLPELDAVSRQAPRCVDAALVLANWALQGDHWGLVRDSLARLEAVVPGSQRVADLRQRVATSCGDSPALRTVLRELLDRDPNGPELRVRLSRLEWAAGDRETARQTLDRGLERCPDHASLLMELAQLEHAEGDDEAAVARARRLLELRPQDRRAQRLLHLLGEEGEDLSWRRPPEQLWQLADSAGSGSPAVVALAHVEVHFLPGNLTEERVQRAILITAAERADSHLRHTLPYVPERQRLRVLGARILRRDGSEVSARQRDTPRLSDPELNLFYDTRLRVLDFQEFENGDLVEIAYVLSETAEANETGPYKGGILSVGTEVPVALAEVELIAPEELQPTVELVGLEAEAVSTRLDDGSVRLRWTWTDVPAVPRDMPPAPRLVATPHMVYSNHGEWGELADWYARHTAPRVRASQQVEETAHRLVRGVEDRGERILRIYRFVANEITYVGLELGEHRFRPFSADWVLSHRIGDCKDKAALLVALYGVIGVDARMVLVRSADSGPVVAQTALLEAFNHVIVYLPEDDMWLDGTAAGHDPSVPPAFDQGAWVLVVDGPESRPQTTPVVGAGVRRVDYTLRRVNEGVVELEVRTEDTGEAASQRRSSFAGRADSRRLAQWLQRQFPGAELVGEPELSMPPSRDPATAALRATVQRTALLSGGGIPTFPEGLNLLSRLATGGERGTPLLVLLRPDLEWTLDVDLGREPGPLPPSEQLETPYGVLRLDIEPRSRGYRVEGSFHLESHLLQPAEAAALRDFLVAVERHLTRPLEVP